MSKIVDKINSFRNLKPDWDSYGAEPIREDVIIFAKNLLPFLPAEYKWDAVPTSSSGVQLEAHSKGKDIEIEIFIVDSNEAKRRE